MSMTLLATACAIASIGSHGPDYIGVDTTRDNLIINSAPYQPATADAGRAKSGRLWVNSGDRLNATQNPGHYGAPDSAWEATIYVRVDKTPVAISPWQRLDKQGFQRHELARNMWLKEQGYTHAVRTHVNTNYRKAARVDVQAIKPGAVIRFTKPGDGPVANAE